MRVVEKAPGRWLCDVRGKLPGGKTYRKKITAKVTSRTAALAFAEAHWRKVLSGVAENLGPDFDEFAKRWIRDYCKANNHKPSGIAHKELMIRTHLSVFSGMRLGEITTAAVDKLRGDLLAKGKKPKTINNALVVLSKMLKTAVRWDELDETARVDLLKVERKAKPFYSFDRYDQLVDGARKAGKRCLAVVLLAGDAGMRRGEILALEWGDVDFERRTIVVQRSQVYGKTGSTKGNAARYVPMTDALCSALADLRRYSPRVIGTLSAYALRTMVEAAEREAGLPVTGRLHVLRHTQASHAAMLGESIYKIQQVLGHQDAATTQGYAHLAPSSLQTLSKLLDARRERARIGPPTNAGVVRTVPQNAPEVPTNENSEN